MTECEIFLSLSIKFLDPDKPLWQRALALEVLHRMTVQPGERGRELNGELDETLLIDTRKGTIVDEWRGKGVELIFYL